MGMSATLDSLRGPALGSSNIRLQLLITDFVNRYSTRRSGDADIDRRINTQKYTLMCEV